MRPFSIRRALLRVRRALRFEVHAYWRSKPIQPGTVLYESFAGNGMLDNPEAIFRHLLGRTDMAHLTHIWVLNDLHRYRSTIAEFESNPSVRFVEHGSFAYFRALATSEYLINNSTFPPDFDKRPGQTYLNTWHGTPLKRMGFDMPGGAKEAANTFRNFLSADYLLAANPFMTEQMYERSYKLDGIYRGAIIEEGYPRIDRQFLDAAEEEATRARLAEAGLPVGDRKIVLYAPTWKGETFSRPIDDVDALLADVAALESALDLTECCVLLKAHQQVHKLTARRPELRRMLVPNEIPTNVLLGMADALVTDYSSIFFDYLATGRPIVFYAPDIEEYRSTRGLYLEPEEWPGPLCRTLGELAAAVRDAIAHGVPEDVAPRYQEARRRFCEREDGHATARVVDIMFRGRRKGYRIHDDFEDDRPSILIYLGGMKPNGITSSVLYLLNNIDLARYDVTAFLAASSRVQHYQEIPPGIRQVLRVGGMNGSKFIQVFRHIDHLLGRMEHYKTGKIQRRLWRDEWSRCFGPSRFDYVVDFSGYSPFWACLLQQSPGPVRRSIWLHNDMAAGANRMVKHRKRSQRQLQSMVALYDGFDSVVSVSPALAKVNKAKLSTPEIESRFTSAVNIIDADYVRERAQLGLFESLIESPEDELPGWATALASDDDVTTFVTAGRLTVEKNHARLIRAFARVHSRHPATRLIIMGGGPREGALRALVQRLRLDDSVFLTGSLRNPHPVMVRSDCFVLSSDYEGQPMVILEALILGLPVVTVAFGSVADALPAGTGLIVPQTDDALAEGMEAYLQGRVPNPPFDADLYNRQALQQFYTAIGIPEKTPA